MRRNKAFSRLLGSTSFLGKTLPFLREYSLSATSVAKVCGGPETGNASRSKMLT